VTVVFFCAMYKYSYLLTYSIYCSLFSADSTRVVYQRKLQRWLQYGPTTDTSALESSQVEPHVSAVAQLEMASVVEEPSVCSSRSVNIDVGSINGPTSFSTKVISSTNAAEAIMAVGTNEKHDASSVRMSRSEVIPRVEPYSLTFAECGSELFSETANGLSDAKRMMRPKAKPVDNEPVVTSS